ncbi:MAG TPA: M15 family metallopeptidase [Actinomycetes bacterium]
MRRVVALSVAAGLLAAGCAGRHAPASRSAGSAGPTPLPATSSPAVASTGPLPAPAPPRFHGRVAAIDAATRARMRYSWRPGCPVGLSELRLLTVDHWGFDGRVHRGELVVQRRYAPAVLRVLARLFADRFPIARMRLVDAYRGDDDRSVAANNTSAFNCRPVAGTRHWSEHAYGRAIDLDPVQNPYVTAGGRVTPPAAGPFADRGRRAPGMVHDGDATVRAFAAIGWGWGGHWRGAKDYQHFSASGR